MGAVSGRTLRISRDGTPIAGARMDRITIGVTTVDITDKDDAGWQTLLADVGVRTVSAQVEGVLKSAVVIQKATAANTALIEGITAVIGDKATLTGNAHFSNLELSGDPESAVEFSATLDLTGTISRALAPYILVAPTLTGTVTVGDTLTTANGTWGGDATITYTRNWQRSTPSGHWVDLTASGLTRTIIAQDLGQMLRVRWRAQNSVGFAFAFSNALGPVVPLP